MKFREKDLATFLKEHAKNFKENAETLLTIPKLVFQKLLTYFAIFLILSLIFKAIIKKRQILKNNENQNKNKIIDVEQ